MIWSLPWGTSSITEYLMVKGVYSAPIRLPVLEVDTVDEVSLSFFFKHKPSDRKTPQLVLSFLEQELSDSLQSEGGATDVASVEEKAGNRVEIIFQCAVYLAHDLSVYCYERGLLFSRIWNLYTSTTDWFLKQKEETFEETRIECEGLKAMNRRLEPVLEWFEESKEEALKLKLENERLSKSLIVVEAERDYLIKKREELNENHLKLQKESQSCRAQQRWALARYKTQTEELIKKLKKDIKQLLICVKMSGDTATRLKSRLRNAGCQSNEVDLILQELEQMDRICGNSEEAHRNLEGKVQIHGDLADGFTEKFLSREEEKKSMFDALVNGLDRSARTFTQQLEKYLSPQENEIIEEIKEACWMTAANRKNLVTQPVPKEDSSSTLSSVVLTSFQQTTENQEILDMEFQSKGDTAADHARSENISLLDPKLFPNEHCSPLQAEDKSFGCSEVRVQDVGVQAEVFRLDAKSGELEKEVAQWKKYCQGLEEQLSELKAQLENKVLECQNKDSVSSRPALTLQTNKTELHKSDFMKESQIFCQRCGELGADDAENGASPRSSRAKKQKAARTIQAAFRSHSAKKSTNSEERVKRPSRRDSLYPDKATLEKENETEPRSRLSLTTELFLPRDVRLLDVVKKHRNSRIRSKEWLLRFIEDLYKAKRQNDEQRAQAGLRSQSLPDFMFKHLSGFYGTKGLVNEYSASVVATVNKYHRQDVRVEVFGHFLSELWDTGTLALFLTAFEKLQEASKVPCVEFPPDYSKGKIEPYLVDVRKCMDVVTTVLGPTTKEVQNALRELLLEHSTMMNDPELINRYFVTPGVEFKDAQFLKSAELTTAEFYVLPDILLLSSICKEHIRCEKVLCEELPLIFKDSDTNHDGTLSREEIEEMLISFNQAVNCLQISLPEMIDEFWEECVFFQLVQNTGIPWKRKKQVPAGEVQKIEDIGFQAFSEAAMKNVVIRSYVRLNRLQAPDTGRSQTDAESLDLYLLTVIDRQWRIHQMQLLSCVEQSGGQESILRELVSKLSDEIHGGRKANIYHSILRLLSEQFMKTMQEKYSKERMANGIVEIEDILRRAADAIKILYGCSYILDQDLTNPSLWCCRTTADKSEQSRMLHEAVALHNKLRPIIKVYAKQILSSRAHFMLQKCRQ